MKNVSTTGFGLSVLLVFYVLFLTIGLDSSVGQGQAVFVENTSHHDYRKTPKLLLTVDWDEAALGSESGMIEAAKSYFLANKNKFQIDQPEEELKYVKTEYSLLGAHVRFQQQTNSLEVAGAEIIVSFDLQTRKIYRIYNNYFPVRDASRSLKSLVSTEQAFDIAWADLSVQGELLGEPVSQLQYQVSPQGKFNLVIVTLLHVASPRGAWEHVINAGTGRVVSRRDTRIQERRKKISKTANFSRRKFSKPTSRLNSFARFDQRQKSLMLSKESKVARRDGKGLVFDPDPRTSTGLKTLWNESAEKLFQSAYVERPLRDLAFVDGTYRLEGPWVKIVDFEPPQSAPSQSSDGFWGAKRGDNKFNDVMTYFHIDQNQRYIQSLGFKGKAGIQNVAIEIDTNGSEGEDNSHFLPISNQLAFGHGCVDDNEDADVILHEYSHALNDWINHRFTGGDTGAMGEGFGDYWAASYSNSLEKGREFDPNRVYTWDGSDGCWEGRRLDAKNTRYKLGQKYAAHAETEDGNKADELWSTPLFQSMLTLIEQGYDREDSDRIILEAQFGLGAALTMRDMASSIVATASKFYPENPHASIFEENFKHHQIIADPEARLVVSSVSVKDQSGSVRVDPGERMQLIAKLTNEGKIGASSVVARLKSLDKNVKIHQKTSEYSKIAPGLSATNNKEFKASIKSGHSCGTPVKLLLTVDYQGIKKQKTAHVFEVMTGRAEGFIEEMNEEAQKIPDSSDEGISSSIHVNYSGKVNYDFGVYVNIKHDYVGDLIIKLMAPSGKIITLFRDSHFESPFLEGVFGEDIRSKDSLKKLIGEELSGEWKLLIMDLEENDKGNLVSWGIKAATTFKCD